MQSVRGGTVLEGEPQQQSCALHDVAGGTLGENQGTAPRYELDQLPMGTHGTHIGAIATERGTHQDPIIPLTRR